jgi:putative membrane protein
MRGRYVVVSTGFHWRLPSRSERLVTFIIRWLILSAAVWVAAELVGGIHLEGWESTLLVGLILGLLNAIVRPILVLISLPLTVITLGLFLLVLNTAMLGLTAWIAGKFDDIQFAIDGFWPAFFGALIISVVSWVLGMFIGPGRMARSIVH